MPNMALGIARVFEIDNVDYPLETHVDRGGLRSATVPPHRADRKQWWIASWSVAARSTQIGSHRAGHDVPEHQHGWENGALNGSVIASAGDRDR